MQLGVGWTCSHVSCGCGSCCGLVVVCGGCLRIRHISVALDMGAWTSNPISDVNSLLDRKFLSCSCSTGACECRGSGRPACGAASPCAARSTASGSLATPGAQAAALHLATMQRFPVFLRMWEDLRAIEAAARGSRPDGPAAAKAVQHTRETAASSRLPHNDR